MNIQFLSDLHLEFGSNMYFMERYPVIPNADILVMAGDIVTLNRIHEADVSEFINNLSKNFKSIYWVPGNHEYYGSDILSNINKKIRDNVKIVNNESIVVDDTKIIFSTLWTKISDYNQWIIEKHVGDFRWIRYGKYRMSYSRVNDFHKESIDFIESELAKNDTDKVVVVTHHVPTFVNYPDRYKDSMVNEAFAVELSDIIKKYSPDVWIYGHNHHNNTFKLHNTLVTTNQLGYIDINEKLGFDNGKVISI